MQRRKQDIDKTSAFIRGECFAALRQFNDLIIHRSLHQETRILYRAMFADSSSRMRIEHERHLGIFENLNGEFQTYGGEVFQENFQ